MGTWNYGLLDNDTALDAIGDLCADIRADISRFSDSPAELCAAVGILLQLSAYDFDLESHGQAIIDAVRRADLTALPDDARQLMTAIATGGGKALAERRDPSHPPALLEAISTGAKHSCFGQREPALFATPAGAAYVQAIADRCVEAIERDMAEEDLWSDICREMPSMGLVAVLLVIAPRTVNAAHVESWRDKARHGLAQLREHEDSELDFHEKYHASLERAFALLA